MEKKLLLEKYIILFAIGGMAYFFWKSWFGDIRTILCFCAVERVSYAAGF